MQFDKSATGTYKNSGDLYLGVRSGGTPTVHEVAAGLALCHGGRKVLSGDATSTAWLSGRYVDGKARRMTRLSVTHLGRRSGSLVAADVRVWGYVGMDRTVSKEAKVTASQPCVTLEVPNVDYFEVGASGSSEYSSMVALEHISYE
jgi:hypothetical protein